MSISFLKPAFNSKCAQKQTLAKITDDIRSSIYHVINEQMNDFFLTGLLRTFDTKLQELFDPITNICLNYHGRTCINRNIDKGLVRPVRKRRLDWKLKT